MDSIIEKFKSRNIIVIEDITHRLLESTNFCEVADYNIASLRKWFAIPSGGLAVKQHGVFKDIKMSSPPDEMINIKITAMKKKKKYIEKRANGNEIDKIEFMNLFSYFNKKIALNYKRYTIDVKSKELLNRIDISLIKKTRKENVRYIYENFKESKNIRFLIRNPDYDHNCLLFVPLLVNKKIRGNLIEHFISNSIFCPVHWPIPHTVLSKGVNIDLFNMELSLICDQRYDLSDMKRMITTLGEFNK